MLLNITLVKITEDLKRGTIDIDNSKMTLSNLHTLREDFKETRQNNIDLIRKLVGTLQVPMVLSPNKWLQQEIKSTCLISETNLINGSPFLGVSKFLEIATTVICDPIIM